MIVTTSSYVNPKIFPEHDYGAHSNEHDTLISRTPLMSLPLMLRLVQMYFSKFIHNIMNGFHTIVTGSRGEQVNKKEERYTKSP